MREPNELIFGLSQLLKKKFKVGFLFLWFLTLSFFLVAKGGEDGQDSAQVDALRPEKHPGKKWTVRKKNEISDLGGTDVPDHISF